MTNRQKALEWFRRQIQSVPMPGAKAMYEEAVRALEQPEIVRCKDCRFWNESSKGTGFGECSFHEVKMVTSKGHCFWGTRRINE